MEILLGGSSFDNLIEINRVVAKVGEAKNCQNNVTRVSPSHGNITEKEKLSDKLHNVIRSGN